MYLYVRQATLADGGGFEWAGAVRSRLEEAAGEAVHLWQNAFSPAADRVSWTSWCTDLDTLDGAVQSVRSALPAGGDVVVPGSVTEQLFGVAYGEPDPSSTRRYLRSLRTVGTPGHLDRGLQTGIEMAKRTEQHSGQPTLFLRAATGTLGLVAWLTPFDSMAEFQAANERLLSGSGWVWYRDRQAEAAQSGSITMALHRRVDD